MAIKGSQTKYPHSFAQPEANLSYCTAWADLKNLKTKSNDLNTNYAKTKKIGKLGSNKNHIGRLDLTGFNFNIPLNAEITGILVEYSYKVVAEQGTNYPHISFPDMCLRHTNIEPLEYICRSTANPAAYWKTQHNTFTGEYIKEVNTGATTTQTVNGMTTVVPQTVQQVIKYNLPSPSRINNAQFGVSFKFPKNTAGEGYIYLNNVSITVNYKVPQYTVELVTENNNEAIVETPTTVRAILNNKDLMGYQPTLHLTVPENISLSIKSLGNGSFEKSSDNNQLYIWKPKFLRTAGNIYIDLEITYHTVGNKQFTLTEQSTSATHTLNVVVSPRTTGITEESSEKTLYAIQNTDFTIPLEIPISSLGESFYLYTDKQIQIKTGESSYTTVNAESFYTIPANSFDEYGRCNLTAKTSNTGIINLTLTLENIATPENITFVVKVVPEGYTIPRLTILKLSQEECDRMGDKYNYEIQSNMRINTVASNSQYFVDYYRNFRIGVVNHIQETLNATTIFNACNEWSNGLTSINEFEKEILEFTFNKDYPVYIIITGNYNETVCDLFELDFTAPQIIEKNRDDGFDTVLFPVPIKDIISSEAESIASITLSPMNTTNNLIFYDFPFEDTFSSKMNLAVRGIGVRITGNVNYSTIVSAKLTSPAGITGERSLVLASTNREHLIGSTTDRWGFTVSELSEIENFILELNVINNANSDLDLSIEKVEFIVYYTFYENQLVDWLVEGENMAGFNCFLEDVEIPEGIKSSVKYLNVDGTDTNNAYRQNIKEKEITVEFTIDECSIEEAASTLQDVTEILQTERDRLYRPIPKRVEFSHYPGRYWMYLLEDTIEAKADGASYNCKAKLTIPAGTAFTTDEISTGKAGRVGGIAKINPVINVTPTSTHIELVEEYTNQKFSMTYDEWTTSDTVEIDCENRKVILQKSDDTSKDITAYVDFNVDWILLFGQFMFDESGCILNSVTWTERK